MNVFTRILATLPSIDQKYPPKCKKQNSKCRKTKFKYGKRTFSPVLWQRYLQSMKNNLQSSKNRTANAVKPVSQRANKRFNCMLATILSIDKNNLRSYKNRKSNRVKPVSKLANERFCPYLYNGTFHRLKITYKKLKENIKSRKTRFKTGELMFSLVSWQRYPQSSQNNLQSM